MIKDNLRIYTNIREFRPSFMFATVDYDEPLSSRTSKAKVRTSYRSTNLRVEYGRDDIQIISFSTGEFETDWNDLVEFINQIAGNDAHVMCSSTVDDYMFYAGYNEVSA